MSLSSKSIGSMFCLIHLLTHSLSFELCTKSRCYSVDQDKAPFIKDYFLKLHHCFGLLHLKTIANFEDGRLKVKDLDRCTFEFQNSNTSIEVLPMRKDFQFCSYGTEEPTCITNSQQMAPKPLPPLPSGDPWLSQSVGQISSGVLVCGGFKGKVDDPSLCHLFNQTSKQWQTFPHLLIGADKSLMISNAEKVALIGGRISKNDGTKSTQIFNGTAWILGPEMNTKGWDAKSVALNQSHHLVVGGFEPSLHFNNDVILFDLNSEIVHTIASYPQSTVIMGAMKYSHEGKDFVICFGDQSTPVDKIIYKLDLDHFTWSKFAGETPTTFVAGKSMAISSNVMWIALVYDVPWEASPYYYKLTIEKGLAKWDRLPSLPIGVVIGTQETELIE